MWDLFQAGGPIMWPLLVCSVVSLSVILERVYFWLRLNLDDDRERIAHLLEGRQADAEHAGDHDTSLVSHMLTQGLAHAPSAGKAMEVVALDALADMRRGMPVLDTIITIAPMLGILGTVTGIITSFDMLGQSGVEDPAAVVSGIAEALITTATGLSISVATVFPYNYFNARIDAAQDRLDAYATRLELAQDEALAHTHAARG
ncbi:MAG: MotA/TolQ/ExbB proton channel family protein [Desulfovibrio sp.]|nr:MotA/TolQ/ExbB proton channel family protein [Desulfovibrio sp.]